MSAPTLAEFLLARIADMESAADLLVDGSVEWIGGRLVNPHALLLADCAAKRRIVERHGDEPCNECEWYGLHGGRYDGICPTMRDLAAIYRDHPDYRQEWRQ